MIASIFLNAITIEEKLILDYNSNPMDKRTLVPLKQEYEYDPRTTRIIEAFTPALLGLAKRETLLKRAAFQIQATDEINIIPEIDKGRVTFLSQVLGRAYAEFETLHKEPTIAEFIQNNFGLAREMLISARPGSNQEYLALTVLEAMSALNKGNYGIGAIYIIKEGDKEYIISGQNSLFTDAYPHSHAEHNSMKHVVDLSRGDIRNIENVIAVRSRTDGKTDLHSEIATSLEPCPMCMLGMLNHEGQTGKDFKKVIIGAKDDGGAFWLENPLKKLPPVWRNILKATGLKIDLADFTGDKKKRSTFINKALNFLWRHLAKNNGTEVINEFDNPEIDMKFKDLMFRVFLDTRNDIDSAIQAGERKAVDLHQAAEFISSEFPFTAKLPQEE